MLNGEGAGLIRGLGDVVCQFVVNTMGNMFVDYQGGVLVSWGSDAKYWGESRC